MLSYMDERKEKKERVEEEDKKESKENKPGVYIFQSPPKIWVIGWLGKKYDNLLRKGAKNMGVRGGKKGNKNWKNIIFEKGEGGKKIYNLNIYTPEISF